MKKIYVLATALLLGASLQAQQTVDFESVVLSPNSYDNGSSGNGDFLLGSSPIRFSNTYTSAWDSWTGYAISNMVDTVTAGYLNQYSAFTGAGCDSSSAYAVGYGSSGNISCENEYQYITSFKITNSTYTAISMRDGDAYAKQFGSVNNAMGIPDGTNGEDFYRVWVYCEDYSGANKDTIEVLLADYRFADSTQDYIVDEWLDVDFQNVGFPVNRIQFELESSDIGDFGMNTPGYYVIDNVVSDFPVGLIENEALTVSVYPNPVNNFLNIEGENGMLTLTNLNGRVVLSQEHTGTSKVDFSNLSNGVYILSVTNSSGRFSEKIVK
ncbi:MAG: DUF4465 domain-containing protein [Crocinitomicaceae bacterium]|nr:DUF4465 domain-containing protein [Crocinitomicaceae bacterium]MDG1777392.1 DUF4465 domain-containing protein [Crocinitomicaceae bacterium]